MTRAGQRAKDWLVPAKLDGKSAGVTFAPSYTKIS
jgi:hypothetical protein